MYCVLVDKPPIFKPGHVTPYVWKTGEIAPSKWFWVVLGISKPVLVTWTWGNYSSVASASLSPHPPRRSQKGGVRRRDCRAAHAGGGLRTDLEEAIACGSDIRPELNLARRSAGHGVEAPASRGGFPAR